jgi:hypothetical protein
MIRSQRGAAGILASESRLPLICGAIAAVALIVVVASRVYQGGYLSYVSGTWAALADDVAHGTLYRPLLSPLGYGGTRYFPLYFALNGALVALGMPLRAAGHLLSILSALLLAGAGALGLRRLGASRGLAFAGGVLALASRTAVMGAAGVRGDLLPVALGVAGLAFLPRDERKSVLPSILLFGLAVVAKPTAVWPACGALIALVASGQIRRSMVITASAAGVAIFGLLIAIVCSHGEMLASFRAVGSGGGFSTSYLYYTLTYNLRPGEVFWVISGLGLWAVRGRSAFKDPYFASLLACLVVTALLYCGRGMHVNHFVDMSTMGALAAMSSLCYPGVRMTHLSKAVLILATVLSVTEFTLLDGMVVKHGELDRAAAAIGPGKDPILSEDPWIPILAGERPFLVDSFSLEQMRRSSPALHQDLLDRLDQCRFRAVALLGTVKDNVPWYAEADFGTGFAEHLNASYSFAGIVGAHAIYLPACASSPKAQLMLAPGASIETETQIDRGAKPSRLHAILHWLRGH